MRWRELELRLRNSSGIHDLLCDQIESENQKWLHVLKCGVQDGRDPKIVIKDSNKKCYLIITHNSKTIDDRFTKFGTLKLDMICCKYVANLKSLRGSNRLLWVFKVGAIFAATTVSRQPGFQGLFRPTPLEMIFIFYILILGENYIVEANKQHEIIQI